MHAPDLSWPTTQWKLTAPESYVLLNGPQASGAEAFRLALMELVGRGALRVVQVQQPGMLGLGRRVTVVAGGASPPADLDPTLESIWQLYTSLPLQTFSDGTVGVPVQELARAVQQRYGSPDGYVALQVLPALVERGLFRREEYRKLFLFPATRYVLTPDGRAARSELQGLVALGNQQFGGWAGQDPARALAFMGLAGASMFLMPLLLSEVFALGDQGYLGDFDFSGLDRDALSGIDTAFADFSPAAESSGMAEASGGLDGSGFDGGGFGGGGDFSGGGDFGGGGC